MDLSVFIREIRGYPHAIRTQARKWPLELEHLPQLSRTARRNGPAHLAQQGFAGQMRFLRRREGADQHAGIRGEPRSSPHLRGDLHRAFSFCRPFPGSSWIASSRAQTSSGSAGGGAASPGSRTATGSPRWVMMWRARFSLNGAHQLPGAGLQFADADFLHQCSPFVVTFVTTLYPHSGLVSTGCWGSLACDAARERRAMGR